MLFFRFSKVGGGGINKTKTKQAKRKKQANTNERTHTNTNTGQKTRLWTMQKHERQKTANTSNGKQYNQKVYPKKRIVF